MPLNRQASAGSGRPRPPRYSEAELLRFLAAHERFARGEKDGQRAIWRFVQAPNCDFSGRSFALADLTGANLQHCRLVRTNLERACLRLADLRHVDAAEASFIHADIRGVSLRRSNLAGAKFDGADMREAVLSPAGVSEDFRLVDRTPSTERAPGDVTFEVDFTHCSLRSARLNHARLNRANFTGACLAGADLTGADLRGGRFRGAILTGVKLNGARIDPGALDDCVRDPSPQAIGRTARLLQRLAEADRWVASGGAEGAAAELDGEDLRPLGPALVGRRLTALGARRTCAVGMSFAGAQLQGARFDDADLRDADFSGADLRGASFRGAKLGFARFTGADLRPLPLASGGERAIDLTAAEFGPENDQTALAGARRA